jgi:hypothetical protein
MENRKNRVGMKRRRRSAFLACFEPALKKKCALY